MKLNLTQPFTLEIPHEEKETEIITGALSSITKEQKIKIRNEFENNKAKSIELQKKSIKLNRLAIKVQKAEKDNVNNIEDIYDKYDKLSDEVFNLSSKLEEMETQENVAQTRFNTLVKSNKLDRLKEIANIVGFTRLMKAIDDGVEEGKQKELENSSSGLGK
jgi:predicted nuclease with TOPRIM domain